MAQAFKRKRYVLVGTGNRGTTTRGHDRMAGSNDRLRQRAGSRAGSMSVLRGVAALQSSLKGGSVLVKQLA